MATSEPRTVSADTPARQPDSGVDEDFWDRLGRGLGRLAPAAPHLRLLFLLLLASLLLRLLWLARPDGALIFDEKYYVNAARVIASLPPQQDTYQDRPLGLDPNTEHPPLAKLLVAGSILLLGDNAYGWRIPSVLAGSLSVLLLYRIGARLTGDPYLGLLAAALLAFDNLVFVHGRIFTLDIFMLAFMLLGFDLYLRGRATLSGVGFALAALCKIPGLFGLFALVGYEALRLLRGEPDPLDRRKALRRLAQLGVTFLVVFLLLLGLMDRAWVGYSQPFEHLQRIISYGQVLRRQVPSGVESYPWQWLWNDVAIPYLKVEQQVRVGEEVRENRPIVFFLGAMNPFVLALWPLGLSLAGYVWWRRQPGADLGALALAWFAATFLPFVAASLFGQRISYLFYFLPVLPAITLAGSFFLLKTGLPRVVLWTYLTAVLLGFYGYFPFKPIP
jgi:predicted membrane-bound dolichyl-phosphate-mannose-protein mannosyltransferase